MSLLLKVGLGLLLVLMVFAIVIFVWSSRTIEVKTDGDFYKKRDSVKVEIKNKFWDKEVCLSSCHPYFLERKNGGWKRYDQVKCPSEDRISVCLSPREERVFKTTLPAIGSGVYRLSVPVCRGCNLGTVFFEDGYFPSNEFKIR